MLRKPLKRKIKKQNTSLITRYSDMLDDLMSEGRSLEESLHILNSKISKSKEKVKLSAIIKRLNNRFYEKSDNDYEIEYFSNIFSSKN